MARTKKSEQQKIEKTFIEKPVWLKYTEEEAKAIILKLANKGMSAEKIGLTLRDQYGIPKVKIYNFKIKEVLGNKYEDPNVTNLRKKAETIESHNQEYKKDRKAERALIITKAQLKKREDYLAKQDLRIDANAVR